MADTVYTISIVPSMVHSENRKICLLPSQLTFPHFALPLSNQMLVLVTTATYLHFKFTISSCDIKGTSSRLSMFWALGSNYKDVVIIEILASPLTVKWTDFMGLAERGKERSKGNVHG